MTALVALIAVSLLVAAGFLVAFLWAWRSGQFDDTHTPGWRAIFDDIKTDRIKSKKGST